MRTIPREVKHFAQVKRTFTISEIQKAVLIGTMLGDASLQRRGKEYRLHIKHGASQLFFVHYKRAVFDNITSMAVREFEQLVKGKTYHFAEFVTLTHPTFSEYYALFYQQGEKHIPASFSQLIKHPLTLATWFMDDGSSEYAGVSFNTQCFLKEELEKVQTVLKNTFNLETSLRRNKKGWVIYIKKASLSRFIEIVKPYILPNFLYKLRPYETNV